MSKVQMQRSEGYSFPLPFQVETVQEKWDDVCDFEKAFASRTLHPLLAPNFPHTDPPCANTPRKPPYPDPNPQGFDNPESPQDSFGPILANLENVKSKSKL